MIETSKIVQAICYILCKIHKADKIKILKLLFLADKRHLLQYGMPLTGDEYWAMKMGPIGSTAKDLLSADKGSGEYSYAISMLKKDGLHSYKPGSNCKAEKLNLLSQVEFETLDYIIKQFGNRTPSQLIDYTHRYPEWSRYEGLFSREETKRERIDTGDIFSVLDEKDPLFVSPDHIEESKKIFNGTFD